MKEIEAEVTTGVSPNEELDEIMKDIEKYRQEEMSNQDESNNNGYVDPRVEMDEQGNIVEEKSGEEQEANNEPEKDNEEQQNELDLFKEKYHLEKKKRKTLYADRQNLEDENKHLKELLDNTVNTNAELYGRDLRNALDKVRDIKKQALLGEDPNLFLESDELYQKILYKVNEFENMQSQQETIDKPDDKPVDNDVYIADQQAKYKRGERWLRRNQELVEGSDKFNPVIQKEVVNFIKDLDNSLLRANRGDEILSDDYMDALEDFLDDIKVKSSREGYTASKVGGVNNISQGTTKGTNKITLTKFEENYAKNLGLSKKEYLKYKLQDMESKKK